MEIVFHVATAAILLACLLLAGRARADEGIRLLPVRAERTRRASRRRRGTIAS